MRVEIISQRFLNVVSGTLAMTAQRLPFLKNLTPLFGAGSGVPFAAPLTVTFVGTHALSGQSISIVPLVGATDTAAAEVGEEFQWAFRSSEYEMLSVRVETNGQPGTPDGLEVAPFQSGIYFLFGIPTTPGSYTLTLTGYRGRDFSRAQTAAYTLNLTVEGSPEPISPFEEFAASFWQGDDLEDPAIAGPTADPDSDGLENQLEFVLDLDPTRPDAFPGTFGTDPENPEQIRYEIPLNALASAANVTFEETGNPASKWSEVAPVHVERTDDFIVLTAPRADRRFYRLRARLD
jgi:hypothetical protein